MSLKSLVINRDTVSLEYLRDQNIINRRALENCYTQFCEEEDLASIIYLIKTMDDCKCILHFLKIKHQKFSTIVENLFS